jgi:opacity protein-like surface antigen
MKNLLPVLVLTLAAASASQAQDDHGSSTQVSTSTNVANAAAEFTNGSAAASFRSPESALWRFSEPRTPSAELCAEPASVAAPEPLPASPAPKYVYGSRDDFRWQLGLGISLVRFRSSLYYATGVGTNTSITYFTSDWLGVEGNLNTAFAPTINQNEHVKYVSYGGGPKIAWRARKLEPWAHAILGGVHILPQTAGFSQNGLALQVGGGADYRIYPHLSARLELDWVKTHLFGDWQNSAQANLDIVLHF